MKTKPSFLLLFILFSVGVSAQSIVYYPFNSLLGFSTNPTKKVWIDAKLQTNSYFSSLSTELSPEINLNNNPKARIFIGAGLKLNYLNFAQNSKILEGYFLNSGVRASPFEKYNKIQIVFEVSPFVNRKFDIGLFRSHLGIGYRFR